MRSSLGEWRMVFEKVAAILSSQFDVDADSITAETDIVDDLGADSLDVFQIIMGIEDEFGIEVPAEAAEGIKTVEEAVEAAE